jgi:hypothetical protein
MKGLSPYQYRTKKLSEAVATLIDRVGAVDEVMAVAALANVAGALIATSAKSRAEAEQRLAAMTEAMQIVIDSVLPTSDVRQ